MIALFELSFQNERGQVDVWSEKCLPPGTVHLRLPRLVPVAKRLEIDFAPAMVGFDFRNGRSIPVFDGIVVCAEFRNAILEVHELTLIVSVLNALSEHHFFFFLFQISVNSIVRHTIFELSATIHDNF